MKDLVDKWDANFIEVDQETMFKLLLVNNKYSLMFDYFMFVCMFLLISNVIFNINY
jgi:hypothetical protein